MNKQDTETVATESILTFLDEFAGLPRDEVTLDTSLFMSGRLSSADAIDLFIYIDQEFGLRTDMVNIDLAEWDTVAMICSKIITG